MSGTTGAFLSVFCKFLACGPPSLSGNLLITLRKEADLLPCPKAKLASSGHTLLGSQAIYHLKQVARGY